MRWIHLSPAIGLALLVAGFPGIGHTVGATPTEIVIQGPDLLAADLLNTTRKADTTPVTMWLAQTNEWQEIVPSQSPSARHGSSMVWELPTGLGLLVGGRDTNFVLLNETWTFDLGAAAWTRITSSVAPEPRFHGAMTFDPTAGASVLFGGRGQASRLLNDTWIHSPQPRSWTNVTPLASPDARLGHAMTFVPELGGSLLFGGEGSTGLLNDTWLFNATRREWVRIVTAAAPSVRMGHRVTYSRALGGALLFGGNGAFGFLSDTWIFNPATVTWRLLTPSPSPAARYGHVLLANTTTEELVLFGGSDGLPFLNDTWVFEPSSLRWKLIAPLSAPPGVFFASGYFDAQLQTVLVFGGIDPSLGTNRTYAWGVHRPWGRLETRTKDLTAFGQGLIPLRIRWAPSTQPPSTLLRAQIASSDSLVPVNFVGPDGAPSSYYEGPGEALWSGHSGNRYLRVRMEFWTTRTAVSPELHNITIEAAVSPTVTLLLPAPGQWTNETTPEFDWSVQDPDTGDEQSAFEVQVSSEQDFSTVAITSGQVSSNVTRWTMPAPGLDEGQWHWRVRTRDFFLLWSPWSNARMVAVDTVPPQIALQSIESSPLEGRYVVTIRWTATDSGSGLAQVDFQLDSYSVRRARPDGIVLSDVVPGPHSFVITATDAVGNVGNLEMTFQLEEPFPIVGWTLAFVGVAVAVGVGSILLLKRRRGTKSKRRIDSNEGT